MRRLSPPHCPFRLRRNGRACAPSAAFAFLVHTKKTAAHRCSGHSLSIKAHLRRQRHIRQAQSLAEMPLPSICTFLGSPKKYFSGLSHISAAVKFGNYFSVPIFSSITGCFPFEFLSSRTLRRLYRIIERSIIATQTKIIQSDAISGISYHRT